MNALVVQFQYKHRLDSVSFFCCCQSTEFIFSAFTEFFQQKNVSDDFNSCCLLQFICEKSLNFPKYRSKSRIFFSSPLFEKCSQSKSIKCFYAHSFFQITIHPQFQRHAHNNNKWCIKYTVIFPIWWKHFILTNLMRCVARGSRPVAHSFSYTFFMLYAVWLLNSEFN